MEEWKGCRLLVIGNSIGEGTEEGGWSVNGSGYAIGMYSYYFPCD